MVGDVNVTNGLAARLKCKNMEAPGIIRRTFKLVARVRQDALHDSRDGTRFLHVSRSNLLRDVMSCWRQEYAQVVFIGRLSSVSTSKAIAVRNTRVQHAHRHTWYLFHEHVRTSYIDT